MKRLSIATGPHPYVGVSLGVTMLPATGDGLRVLIFSFVGFHFRLVLGG